MCYYQRLFLFLLFKIDFRLTLMLIVVNKDNKMLNKIFFTKSKRCVKNKLTIINGTKFKDL